MDLRIFTEPQQGATYDDQLAVARTAEDLGFDAFFRSDHYLGMGTLGLPGPTDAWTTLAGLARDTSTIRLGTLMTSATFRLPGPLAIAAAGVDQMSGGRVELGIGAGWYEAEHTAYGVPFPPVRERFDRLEEQLAVITGLWRTVPGQRFSYAGGHYTLADSPALPKPTQSPHPPVIVGGKGPTRTPALAATYADEFNLPFVGLEEGRAQFARVRQACEEIGRTRPPCGCPRRSRSASVLTRPRWSAGQRPLAARSATSVPPGWPGPRRRRWTRSARTPGSGRRGSTCRSWISATSTTCT